MLKQSPGLPQVYRLLALVCVIGFLLFGSLFGESFVLPRAAAAEAAPGTADNAKPFAVPALTSPVMDTAGVLNDETIARLSSALAYLRDNGGTQITVLTVPSLGGLSIEEASIQITDKWKLGSKKSDDGVLFLIAPSERRMRIEVGRGLEGDLTDVISHRIIEQDVTPLFRSGDLNSGVLVGVYRIAQVTNPNVDLKPLLEGGIRRAREAPEHLPGAAILIIVLLFFLLPAFIFGGRGGRGGPFIGGGGGWGGGSGGGWGGGGGGFSGGGASGGW